MNAAELAAFDVEVARHARADRQNDGVEIGELFLVDHDAGDEFHAFAFQLRETPVDDLLFQLEIRDSVTKQTPDAIVFFEDRYRVPTPRQLLRRRQSRRAG